MSIGHPQLRQKTNTFHVKIKNDVPQQSIPNTHETTKNKNIKKSKKICAYFPKPSKNKQNHTQISS